VDFEQILSSELRLWNLNFPSVTQHRLAEYAGEIERWNKSVNLTALKGEALIRRLIVEPIWVGQELQMTGNLVDVGSGNGSPGIPLSIVRSFDHTFLIEPRLKRAAFLRHIVAKLPLRNAEVFRERIEDLPEEPIKADWVTLQAIDPTADILLNLNKFRVASTRVVWITSRENPPVPSAQRISLPHSASVIWVFSLDQI
jgi:16S rRNA (guanine527-N7)-methyltransferase